MASVFNASTPMFTVLILGAFGDQPLILHRVVGVLISFGGVEILRQPEASHSGSPAIGMLLLPRRSAELRALPGCRAP